MKVLISLFVMFFVSQTQAAIFIEPYLGYYKGESEISSTTSTTIDQKGIGYGARLGFTLGSMFFIAADGLLVKGSYKTQAGVSEDLEILDYAGILGMNLGDIRVWGGYIFQSNREDEDAGMTTEYDGKGWKAGIGYILGRKVSLNIEYIVNKVDSIDGVDLPSGTTTSIENTGFFASLSFPIGF